MAEKQTSGVPDTSTTLLRDVADSQHTRWAVFHSRYEPMMRAFLRERFPALDPDDIIQETFAALVRVLPNYVYNPKENGHFHNYLTGILRNKALKALAAHDRERQLRENASCASQLSCSSHSSQALSPHEADCRDWRQSIYEIALQQLLADDSIHERTKQVFVRTAIGGEKPEAVAESLGIPRATVNRIKERMLERLRNCVEALKDV